MPCSFALPSHWEILLHIIIYICHIFLPLRHLLRAKTHIITCHIIFYYYFPPFLPFTYFSPFFLFSETLLLFFIFIIRDETGDVMPTIYMSPFAVACFQPLWYMSHYIHHAIYSLLLFMRLSPALAFLFLFLYHIYHIHFSAYYYLFSFHIYTSLLHYCCCFIFFFSSSRVDGFSLLKDIYYSPTESLYIHISWERRLSVLPMPCCLLFTRHIYILFSPRLVACLLYIIIIIITSYRRDAFKRFSFTIYYFIYIMIIYLHYSFIIRHYILFSCLRAKESMLGESLIKSAICLSLLLFTY